MSLTTTPTSSRAPVSRRRFLGAAAAATAAATLASRVGRAAQQPARRTNVVLITGDDLGTQLGCYGDPLARTPRLDALAASGTQFRNGYITAPSCSPSRSSILTGLYPHQTGHWGLSHLGYRMRDGVPTLPALLKEAGYRTAILGKLHVAPERAFPFDVSETDGTKTWDVRRVAGRAAQFMADAGDDPFFLYVNYFDPHTPFHDQFEGVPADPQTPAQMRPFPFHPVAELSDDVRKQMAGFYNGVARLDVGVGLLLDAIRKAGRDDDTLVVFIGDHGPPFPRGKNACYEAGLKVPFLVRWPEVARRASGPDDRLVSTIDLVPTILDAADVAVPPDLPGASLRPLLAAGASPAPWRQTLAAENNAHGPKDWHPVRTIRDDRYKLIHTLLPGRPNTKITPSGGKPWIDLTRSQPAGSLGARVFATHRDPPEWQLYDLRDDPHEFVNLAGRPELADVERRLRDQLEAWRRDTGDPLCDPAELAALTKAHDETKGKSFEPPKRPG